MCTTFSIASGTGTDFSAEELQRGATAPSLLVGIEKWSRCWGRSE